MTDQGNKSNKLTIIFLLLACGFPLILSWFLLNMTGFVNQDNTVNRGTLVQPLVPLEDMRLVGMSLQGEKVELPLYGKWNLVYYHNGVCLEQCLAKLDSISRIKHATGKFSHRVQTVYFSSETISDDVFSKISLIPLIKTAVYGADNFARDFNISTSGVNAQEDWLYIIDPLGNLMMYYQKDTDPYDIIKDLKRLLKTSRIG